MGESALQEVEVPFGGKTYRFRPTFSKIVQIEATLSQPSRQLGMKMLNFDASVMEIAAVMTVLLKDEKGAPEPKDIGELVVEDGYRDLMVPLGEYLTRAQKGNKEHEKEARLAKDKPSPQTAPAAG